MDERLGSLAQALGGVFSAGDATRCDVSASALEALVRRRTVVRVRRGAFVLAARYVDRPPSEQFRLRARAVARAAPPGSALSHHSALAAYGVALYGVPFEQIDLVGQVVSARRQSGVVIHPRRALRPVLLAGIPVVPLADAIAQTAVASGAVAGICAADDALHRELTTAAQIASAVRALPRTGRTRAGRFLARADLRSESVGETRVRLLLADLGYSVEVQMEIWDAKGFVGRVDLLVEGLLVVEFDGLVKYAGNGGAGVLVAEKQRESRLVSAGYGVLRLVWSDLADPAAVAGEVRRWVARLRRRRVA